MKIKDKLVKDAIKYLKELRELKHNKSLDKVIVNLEKECKKASDKNSLEQNIKDWWEKWDKAGIGVDSGYTVPEMYYFVLLPIPPGIVQLFLEIKADVWVNNGKFTGKSLYYPSRISNFPPEGFSDDDLDGFFIPAEREEDLRSAMIKAGFEENKEMVEGVK